MRLRVLVLGALSLITGISACGRLVDLGEQPDSHQVPPGTVNSYEGAVGLYIGAIGRMQKTAATYALNTGVFTDELNMQAASSANGGSSLDARTGNDTAGNFDLVFSGLSKVRIQTQQAITALALYPHQASPNMVAELYGIEGMAEVMLTELFCSGVPLTKAVIGQDFQLSASVATPAVLALAIAHFDSALALKPDSAPVVTLVSVGKARALLNLGRFNDAATAVSNVSTDARYGFTYDASQVQNPLYHDPNDPTNELRYVVTSKEGLNGIPWTHHDPRVPLDSIDNSAQWRQAKYSSSDAPFTLADGVEARLIEAEARLQAKDYAGWIAILQTLAQTIPNVPSPTDPGAVAGNDSARVTVQFHERAFWLFLTGHRQGDMRRLMRQYHRIRSAVAPVGLYTPINLQFATYGTDVNVAPPKAEMQNNPLYKGCIDRNP